MRRLVRENALSALMASAATLVMTWLALYGYGWTDYQNESQPALTALVHGHVLAFLQRAPAYGGSLIERAPFALLPGLWGGGPLAVYRAVSIPCMLAAAFLGVWLVANMRSSGRTTRLARGVALAVCVANPITLRALELGHAEELLGASLCVAAVLLAARGHGIWAGLTLGLAIANKQWALAAAGPVIVALPALAARTAATPSSRDGARAVLAACRRPAACLATAAAVSFALLAPLLLVPGGRFASVSNTSTSAIFQPWQVWWFFGHPPRAAATAHHGARSAPAWVTTIAHPSIILASVVLTALLLWVRRRAQATHPRQGDALLLLALVMLARCMLDSWDAIYYALPCVFALVAWEATETRRAPLLALTVTVLVWASFEWTTGVRSGDAIAALYLAWTLPLAAALALRLYAPAKALALTGRVARLLPRWALDSGPYALPPPRLPAPRA
jgi:hypothetical protein